MRYRAIVAKSFHDLMRQLNEFLPDCDWELVGYTYGDKIWTAIVKMQ